MTEGVGMVAELDDGASSLYDVLDMGRGEHLGLENPTIKKLRVADFRINRSSIQA